MTLQSFRLIKSLSIVLFVTNIGVLLCFEAFAQKSNAAKPKLVVGIVIDQMRYDLLYRYLPYMGKGGFKKLLDKGYSFENTKYDYIPTVTGPGHASIYTGAPPAHHGIVGNDWHNYAAGREMYCAYDSSVHGLGTNTKYGQRSPKNLLATTITDELKIANPKSKVVGIAHKDRGSILPAGHLPDAAYWYDFEAGVMVSSSYYNDSLPSWVQSFNQRYTTASFLQKPWTLALPSSIYQNYLPDNNIYETKSFLRDSTSFPHHFHKLTDTQKQAKWFGFTPFANTYLTQFTKAAIFNHNLGLDTHTDFLAISYSTPDLIGHHFGLRSVEIQDCYIRLDRDIQNLLETLDKQVGANNYLLFLTADHGVTDIPALANDLFKLNTRAIGYAEISNYLDSCLSKFYGLEKWVIQQEAEVVYLNRRAISKKGLTLSEVRQKAAALLELKPGVIDVITYDELRENHAYTKDLYIKAQNGFHIDRSPDLLLLLNPGWFIGPLDGTSHSTGYNYDVQVPLVWYGKGIKKGSTVRACSVLDIAPTIASWLQLIQPSAATGVPLIELFGK